MPRAATQTPHRHLCTDGFSSSELLGLLKLVIVVVATNKFCWPDVSFSSTCRRSNRAVSHVHRTSASPPGLTAAALAGNYPDDDDEVFAVHDGVFIRFAGALSKLLAHLKWGVVQFSFTTQWNNSMIAVRLTQSMMLSWTLGNLTGLGTERTELLEDERVVVLEDTACTSPLRLLP